MLKCTLLIHTVQNINYNYTLLDYGHNIFVSRFSIFSLYDCDIFFKQLFEDKTTNLLVNQPQNPNLLNKNIKDKNFGLTESEFNQLMLSLKEGKEKLFEKIFLSHFDNCQKYLTTNHKAPFELAYDITMDTLIQFRQRILTNKIKYGNLRYLFTVMASQNLIKHHQKGKKVDLSPFYIEGTPAKSEAVYDALSYAWEKLNKESRIVLEDFYYKKIPLTKIAAKLGITDTSMRKKKQRCLEKLRFIYMQKYNTPNE